MERDMDHIGVDAHKRLVVAAVVDARGQEQGNWRGPNTPTGWGELLAWADERRQERVWGLEGSGHYGAGLAQTLLGPGEVVYEINPRWVAAARSRSRRRAKSDQADAVAIARLVRQEGEALPRVQPADATSEAAGVAQERARLVAAVTRTRNQLHAELHRLDPTYAQQLPRFSTAAGLEALRSWTPAGLDRLGQVRLATVQRTRERLELLVAQLKRVSAELAALGRQWGAPLRALCGVGELTAGLLLGYLGPGVRFGTDAQLAQYAGIAPLEASSAGAVRHRLNRGGHRALNAIVHRMALTQARCHAPAKAYLARRQAEGKSWREAIRALKRYLIRAIFHAWRRCVAEMQGRAMAA
jgi:transposase